MRGFRVWAFWESSRVLGLRVKGLEFGGLRVGVSGFQGFRGWGLGFWGVQDVRFEATCMRGGALYG